MTYSCVVEPQPKFVRQLHVWTTTLLALGGARASDLLVHVVDGEGAAEMIAALAARGIASARVERFGDGRFCNKLSQLRSAALRERGGEIALCDADLAFSGPVARLPAGARAAAKGVDWPNPPLAMLTELYRRAGFTRFPAEVTCSHMEARTFANNFNGGLYLLRGDLLDALAPRWERWALWTLEQQPFLGSYVSHADQISFGLAAWELGQPVAALPPAANFPTHLPLEYYDPGCEPPVVLHYHGHVAGDGTLLPLGLPQVDERIALVNRALASAGPPAGV